MSETLSVELDKEDVINLISGISPESAYEVYGREIGKYSVSIGTGTSRMWSKYHLTQLEIKQLYSMYRELKHNVNLHQVQGPNYDYTNNLTFFRKL